jgi:predicted murein hydrolase (TIGR00659 family)
MISASWSLPCHLGRALMWSALTVIIYAITKRLYQSWRRPWLMPVALTPFVLMVLMLFLGESYQDYFSGTGWLMTLLGPASIAFAVPIYEQRATIRKQWAILLLGVAVGSVTAICTTYLFASLFDVGTTFRASLVPRSFSTPFAMTISTAIGGLPGLTALFVVVTGLLTAAIGHFVIGLLPLHSAIARGALLGMAGHAAGTAKAFEIGREEGSTAGLVMIFAGLLNVAAVPIVAILLH